MCYAVLFFFYVLPVFISINKKIIAFFKVVLFASAIVLIDSDTQYSSLYHESGTL